MNIRTRCLTTILPMFVVLGLATGGLVYFLQYREIYWGLSEEASDTATTTAEFIDSNTINSIAINNASTNGIINVESEWTKKALKKVVETRKIQRIAVISMESKKPLLDFGSEAGQEVSIPDKHASDSPTVIHIPADNGQPESMQAYIAIPGEPNTYMLMTQINASALSDHHEGAIEKMLVYLLSALAVGALCSLVIASILIRAIKDLTESAEQAASGDYDVQQLRSCPIREINDLWNTFLTAVSVLKGVVSSSKRQLLEMELLRTEDDLVRSFSKSYNPSRCLSMSSLQIGVTALSEDQPETIADLIEADGTLYAIAGTIVTAESGIKTAVTASALLDYIKRNIKAVPPETSLKDLSCLFDIVSLRVIAYNSANQDIAIHEFDDQTGLLKKTELTVQDQPMLFHDISSSLGERLNAFVELMKNASCEELLMNLLTISSAHENEVHGAIIVVTSSTE